MMLLQHGALLTQGFGEAYGGYLNLSVKVGN